MYVTILSTLLRPILTVYFSIKYWETGDINSQKLFFKLKIVLAGWIWTRSLSKLWSQSSCFFHYATAPLSFFCFFLLFQLFNSKVRKKNIMTSIGSAQHLNAGKNIQQKLYIISLLAIETQILCKIKIDGLCCHFGAKGSLHSAAFCL